MQESVLVFVVGLFLDSKINNGINIFITVLYGIVLVAMAANICSKNLQLFPNKAGEQVEILKKCVLPFFIILPV